MTMNKFFCDLTKSVCSNNYLGVIYTRFLQYIHIKIMVKRSNKKQKTHKVKNIRPPGDSNPRPSDN